MTLNRDEYLSEYGGRLLAGTVVVVDEKTARRWLDKGDRPPVRGDGQDAGRAEAGRAGALEGRTGSPKRRGSPELREYHHARGRRAARRGGASAPTLLLYRQGLARALDDLEVYLAASATSTTVVCSNLINSATNASTGRYNAPTSTSRRGPHR